MAELAQGWNLHVDRGPDWLFVRVHCPGPVAEFDPDFAENVWHLLSQHFANRLVLELEEVPIFHSQFVGQLILLHKRIHSSGGLMRLCGVSPENYSVLQLMRLSDRFPVYGNREDAVMGYRPNVPR